MIVEETFTIDAPLQQVWDFFFDIDRVAGCVPGAEATQLDENNYTGQMGVKLGPIALSMGGSINITHKSEPNHIEASLKATDRMTASTVQGSFVCHLRGRSPSQTEVSYHLDVALRGRLAQMAQAVVSRAIQSISESFRACVEAELSGKDV